MLLVCVLECGCWWFVFFKQKTAYEMRISDLSSDVCSSDLFSGATTPTAGGGVAFWAHVGGFLAGVALIPVLKRRDVRLFDRPHSRPFEVQTPSADRQSVV